tara:strand:+ start:322 stop:498 length:177 start_codon:yes stop_codon:yes gene_type:complete
MEQHVKLYKGIDTYKQLQADAKEFASLGYFIQCIDSAVVHDKKADYYQKTVVVYQKHS